MRGAELLVTDGEQKSGKTMPDLRFRINKERLQMYINLKNPARAKEQLVKLEETAKAAKMIHSTMICFTPKPITTIPLG